MSEKNHFTIAIMTCNHEKWIERCISSCVTQKYDNYDVILVDAVSNDKTFEFAKQFEKDYSNFKAIQNEVRIPQVANFIFLAQSAKKNSIIVCVDGDDCLKHPKVLQKLDEVYNSNDVWLSYGSYVEDPYRDVSFHYRSYTDDEIKNNAFREAPWLASHLRTYRRELVFKVDEKDLKYDNGDWFETTGDQALTLPLLELSGFHSRFIKDSLYIYNVVDQNRDTSKNEAKQIELAKYIRSKKKYLPLETL